MFEDIRKRSNGNNVTASKTTSGLQVQISKIFKESVTLKTKKSSRHFTKEMHKRKSVYMKNKKQPVECKVKFF